jgi:mRNA interferase MazF
MLIAKQGELWYANLSPAKGSEQDGFRPILIISGNLLNEHAPIVVCCPLTSKIKNYKGNVVLEPNEENCLNVSSEIMTYHIKSISKERLKEKIGIVPMQVVEQIKKYLQEILTY